MSAPLRPNQIRGASLDLPDLGSGVEVIYGEGGEIKSMPWPEWRYACAEAVGGTYHEAAAACASELEHERDLLRDVALRLWNEVEYPTEHRDLAVSLGFVLSMTGDRELTAPASLEPPE